MSAKWMLGGALLATAVAVATSGCNATTNADLDQCQLDSDCEALGLRQNFCDQGQSPKVCRFKERVVETPAAAVNCKTDQECVDKNGGRPAICPKPDAAPCVPLETDLCKVSGDWKNKNRVFVGSIWSDQYDCISCSIASREAKAGWELAMGELNQNLIGGGLPGGVNGARRPIVNVQCEAAGNGSLSDAVATHLVDVVGVDVIQYFTSEDLAAVSQRVQARVANGGQPIFMISPGYYVNARTAVSTILKDPSNVFWTLGADDDVVPAVKPELERMAAIVAATPGHTGPVKVGFIHLDDPYNGPPSQKILATLQGTPLAPVVVAAYKRRLLGLDAAVTQLVTAQPDIVLMAGNYDVGRALVPRIEAEGLHPRYLAVPQTSGLETAIGANENLRTRTTILAPPFDYTNFSVDEIIQFYTKFAGLYPSNDPVVAAIGYEEAYAIAYAIAASGDVTETGKPLPASKIIEGFKRSNVRGEKVFFPGVGSLFDGIAAAYTGKADFQGLYESFNFDYTLGASRGTVDLNCLGRDADGAATGAPGSIFQYASGRNYSLGSSIPQGTFACE